MLSIRWSLIWALGLSAACADTSQPEETSTEPADEPNDPPLEDAGTKVGRNVGDAQAQAQAPRGDASGPNDGGAAKDGGRSDGGVIAGRKPKCMSKDSQMIVIGDSYINWPSHTFPQDMIDESKQTWRMEAVGGYSMATGGLGKIPPTFDSAIAADPNAHSVLMDGGGNDILVSFDLEVETVCKDTGSSKSPACQKIIDAAIAAASAMYDKMVTAGIRDVVYFFYPHIPEGRLIGGAHPNEILDYALPQIKKFCDDTEGRTSGHLRCHWIDMIPVFAGQDESVWFNTDIHPTSVGSKAMAKKVWQVMTDACVGQKVGASCCEP